MNKLLIVEDEKMIRQGLKVMAMRAPVEINEIIECRNGEEALEILKSTEIDVMFTDVRMPKKDGITLVKEMQALPHKPYTVIISGFDDFSYAVDALRCGAKEYILKPVERDVITQVLIKLNNELEEEKAHIKEEAISEEMICQQLKYFLLNPNVTDEEKNRIEKIFEKVTQGKAYRVCTIKKVEDRVIEDKQGILCTLGEHNHFECVLMTAEAVMTTEATMAAEVSMETQVVMAAEDKEIDQVTVPSYYYVGSSQIGNTLEDLRKAYAESIEASKLAYLMDKRYVEMPMLSTAPKKLESKTIEKWVQLLGTHKIDEVLELVKQLLSEVKQGIWQVEIFESVMTTFLKKVGEHYSLIVEEDAALYEEIKDYYGAKSLEDYEKMLIDWLQKINHQAVTIYDDSKNKKKLQEALDYIHTNYNKDLNMAMVSNHISMNYTVFSQLFKEYIGINFVNYLKEIRIEKAKEILMETDEKIIDISVMVGYENEKHFMKVFKNVVGVSPSEYRKNRVYGG